MGTAPDYHRPMGARVAQTSKTIRTYSLRQLV